LWTDVADVPLTVTFRSAKSLNAVVATVAPGMDDG